jgi:magnesium transporter
MFSYHAPGTPPATLKAPLGAQPPVITLMEYDGATLEERQVGSIEETFPCRDNSKVSWINIDGLADVELFRALGLHFGLHPLALEDVLHVPQRPKIEEYADHFFIVAQMVYCDEGEVEFEQVSIFLGRNFLITIQEEALRDVFDPVRARLRVGRGFIRTMRHDYLAYALLDAVVDHFFPVLEVLGERVENLEDRVIEHPTRESVVEIHDLKRQLLRLRRSAWPQREVVNALSRDESGLIHQETKAFLRDCYDHTIQIMDLIETYRDLTSGMMDLYLSSLGIRTNDIMRVLTVVTTIFIPLTFIVGVYGMNFENMPELKSRYGYFFVLGGMAAVAIGMLLFFKRKRWL